MIRASRSLRTRGSDRRPPAGDARILRARYAAYLEFGRPAADAALAMRVTVGSGFDAQRFAAIIGAALSARQLGSDANPQSGAEDGRGATIRADVIGARP